MNSRNDFICRALCGGFSSVAAWPLLALQPSIFREGDDSAGTGVPEDAFQRLANVRQPQMPDTREQMLIFVVALDQAVIGNPGKQMMNVVVANIGGKPVQVTRQDQEAGAVECTAIVFPVLAIARISMLEIVLHGEQHYPCAAGERQADDVD